MISCHDIRPEVFCKISSNVGSALCDKPKTQSSPDCCVEMVEFLHILFVAGKNTLCIYVQKAIQFVLMEKERVIQ